MVDWELYAWVKRSDQRQEIVKFLDEPRTPTDVADRFSIHIAQASRSLREMKDKELTHVLNPEDKLGRLYALTEEGEEIQEQLEESDQS